MNKYILHRPVVTIVTIRKQKRDEILHVYAHCGTRFTIIKDADRLIADRMFKKILRQFDNIQVGAYSEPSTHETIHYESTPQVIDG